MNQKNTANSQVGMPIYAGNDLESTVYLNEHKTKSIISTRPRRVVRSSGVPPTIIGD